MGNPLSNPTPTPGVNAYPEHGANGGQPVAGTGHGGVKDQPGAKRGPKATDLAKPDLRGQTRHPKTGQFTK